MSARIDFKLCELAIGMTCLIMQIFKETSAVCISIVIVITMIKFIINFVNF